MKVFDALLRIQRELKVPKNEYNEFGKFSYRTAEGILEAARPLANECGAVIVLRDSILSTEGGRYVEATAILMGEDGSIESKGYAREPEAKKGMDSAQLTGATSSYARKYALAGLFAISGEKDNDAYEEAPQTHQQASSGGMRGRQDLLRQVVEESQKRSIPVEEVTKLLKTRYNKQSSNELTTQEIKDLLQLLRGDKNA